MYTLETSCMKKTSIHIKDMRINSSVLIRFEICYSFSGANTFRERAPGPCLSTVAKHFRTRKAVEKSNLMITELFNSHILNMNRSCLHTRSLRRKHLSVFRLRLTKKRFRGHETFPGGSRNSPSPGSPFTRPLVIICKLSERSLAITSNKSTRRERIQYNHLRISFILILRLV